MVQPPDLVVRTYKRKGDLRLHRLVQNTRFRCARCQRDKTATLVATLADDWAQTVCNGCYGQLINEQREKTEAKQKGKARQLTASTTETPEQIAKRRKEHLERQFPGVNRLFSFFRAAGVRVEAGKRGSCESTVARPGRWPGCCPGRSTGTTPSMRWP